MQSFPGCRFNQAQQPPDEALRENSSAIGLVLLFPTGEWSQKANIELAVR
jgi:hypothetical protein